MSRIRRPCAGAKSLLNEKESGWQAAGTGRQAHVSCSLAAGSGVGCMAYAEVSCALLPCVVWTTTKWVVSLSVVLEVSVLLQIPRAFVWRAFPLLEEGAHSCEGTEQPVSFLLLGPASSWSRWKSTYSLKSCSSGSRSSSRLKAIFKLWVTLGVY